jgi:hypothetical protein
VGPSGSGKSTLMHLLGLGFPQRCAPIFPVHARECKREPARTEDVPGSTVKQPGVSRAAGQHP